MECRPNLRHVLFEINCKSSIIIGELCVKDTSVFDVYTAFLVKWVSRGPISIIKLEPTDDDGRSLAREYRMKYKSDNSRI
jgi:hypothetical protein